MVSKHFDNILMVCKIYGLITMVTYFSSDLESWSQQKK